MGTKKKKKKDKKKGKCSTVEVGGADAGDTSETERPRSSCSQATDIEEGREDIVDDTEVVDDEAPALPASPASYPQPEPEDATHQNEVEYLTAQLKNKEGKLQDLWNDDYSLIEKKGHEMTALISAVDAIEEEKNLLHKKVAKIDAEIDATVRELQSKKDQLVADIESKDAKLEKLSEKKTRLGNFIDKTVDENKNARRQLEREVVEIKAKIEALNKVEEPQPKNSELLEYIDSQIEAKEKELECPVCLEVVSAPIFRCEELHIICFNCRPKVSTCPECRTPYPKTALRHRYAEKSAEELEELIQKRARILDS